MPAAVVPAHKAVASGAEPVHARKHKIALTQTCEDAQMAWGAAEQA